MASTPAAQTGDQTGDTAGPAYLPFLSTAIDAPPVNDIEAAAAKLKEKMDKCKAAAARAHQQGKLNPLMIVESPPAIINRTPAHAEALARQVQGRTFPWRQMRTALEWADVVITATAALHPILDADDLAAVLPQRRGRRLILVDLGLPRNIRSVMREMRTVMRYDLDDLQAALDESLAQCVASMPQADQRIQQETSAICTWLRLRAGGHGNSPPASADPL